MVGGVNLKDIKDALANLKIQTDLSSINLVGRLDDLQNQIKQMMNNPAMSNNVFDIDGNSYRIVKYGSQSWMAENLKVSKYRNGDSIPSGLDNNAWSNTTSGAYAIYNNYNNNDKIIGKLYNWYAVSDERGLCPTGWHVPTFYEWRTLISYLGGKISYPESQIVAGGKMKSIGTTYWESPNNGATNESGFTALPGGRRNADGSFSDIGYYALFWGATELNNNLAWLSPVLIYITSLASGESPEPKSNGFSIRCLKDL